jgi:UDP-GlcNAc:undecaprenyl-phosphate GlcNAc-1-phosphate transferase
MDSSHITINNWSQILACFGLGLCICWALIGIILRRAEFGLAGQRDFHHSHKEPIPRLGGLAMISAFIVVALAIAFFTPVPASGENALRVIVLSSLAMFVLGFWDDLRPLGAKIKFLAQIAIASSVYLCNIRIELFREPFTGTDLPLGAFGYVATVLWLVSLTNLINLIDGIDGLAGGIGLMLMLLMANLGVTDRLDFCALLAFGVAGALLGFLKYNYPPARIYMGDGGAYFLGFLIGILSIVNSNKGTVAAALIAPAFALALPIVDVSLAILRRGARGLPVFRPDQKHIHHHLLITLGISREKTLLNLYTVSLLCLFLALCVFCLQGRMLPLFTGLLFLVLIVAGYLSGFTRNWIEVGSQLGQSLRLRKETRYALTLDRWFLLEAERRGRLEDLWEDYQFVVKKLGFCRLKLTLPGRPTRIWQAEGFDPLATHLQAAHEISDGTVVELTAASNAMPEAHFSLLGDLAAETWYKAAQRCRAPKAKAQPAAAGSGPTDTGSAAATVPDAAGPQPPENLISQRIYT